MVERSSPWNVVRLSVQVFQNAQGNRLIKVPSTVEKSKKKKKKWKIKNGSILLALQMRHILASLDSVASAAERIQKEA